MGSKQQRFTAAINRALPDLLPTLDRIAREATMSTVDKELLDALTKLSNEVLGSLPLMEPLARRELGNSNYSILIQRAEEARDLVRKLAAP